MRWLIIWLNRAGWSWLSLSSHQSTSPAWPRMVWTTVWKQSNSLNQSRLSKHSIDRNGMFLLEFLKFQPCEETIFQCYKFSSTQSMARQKFPWWQESPSSSPGNPSQDNDHVLHNKTHTTPAPRSQVSDTNQTPWQPIVKDWYPLLLIVIIIV